MAKKEKMTHEEQLEIINKAARDRRTKLNLSGKGITEIPDKIGQLINLRILDLSHNRLTTLLESIGQLTNLQTLDLNGNQLTVLPETISHLTNLKELRLDSNQLTALPQGIGQLNNLQVLDLTRNLLTALPEEIGNLFNLLSLRIASNKLTALPATVAKLWNLIELDIKNNQLPRLPEWINQLARLNILAIGDATGGNVSIVLPPEIGQLSNLKDLWLANSGLTELIPEICQLKKLQTLALFNNSLSSLPEAIGQLTNLQRLHLRSNQLTKLPQAIGQLTHLRELNLRNNQLTTLPSSLARLEKLDELRLEENPLNPALKSVYEAGLNELRAYLRSLEEAEPLYEAKLVLVGEGGIGKTTLLKAMTGQEPKKGEPTTHGVEIDIKSLFLPHPEKEGIEIQLNAWDFGGQEVYRVTHQFFFSRRSIYLLVWEPRMGVQQCQVEDWLRLIRLRVGDDARVIIISTHCKTGERIARIDKPVLRQDFGQMIVDFHEVDSLVDDPVTGEKVGVAELKQKIADTAKDLEQMGMGFNSNWREARDELLEKTEPRITYQEFAMVCDRHGLDAISTKTLADLMHDLGYIVYYSEDDHLNDDVVLQPEWLTKAIGFVLEDRVTQEMDGILPDSRLKAVWWEHSFKDEPKYKPALYPFFLRLMEKYDVSYRLEDGKTSLVAQHVPQVRPDLPWLPEEEPAPDQRRIAMACVMDEAPPGLVPWMIVRTHEYAYEYPGADGKTHRLHWQKGMFLRNKSHGEAMLELRGREFHVYAEAVWPEYFIDILRRTLHKLIIDNWPGACKVVTTLPYPVRGNKTTEHVMVVLELTLYDSFWRMV